MPAYPNPNPNPLKASYSFEPAASASAASPPSLLDAAAGGGGSSELLSLGAPDPMRAAALAGQDDLQLLGGVDMTSAPAQVRSVVIGGYVP